MKNYKNYCAFTDENIADLEKHTAEYAKHIREADLAKYKLDLSRINVNKSIEELDEELVRYYEKTGKIPSLMNYKIEIKKHNGN